MLPFGIFAGTFFSDNLSRNSCIAVYISLLFRGISDLEISEGLGRGKKKSARATMGRGRTSTEQRANSSSLPKSAGFVSLSGKALLVSVTDAIRFL